ATPDALPVVSAVDAVPGFFVATGFSGHGFGIGLAAGDMMAGIVLDRADRQRAEEQPFTFNRFERH
ncbi:MAG TPA: D-amino-acid oxidase, partial [Burkholderiaceae bacterium]